MLCHKLGSQPVPQIHLQILRDYLSQNIVLFHLRSSPSRVGEAEGVAEDIAVSIEALRVGGVGHDGVRAGKAPNARHVVPRIHVNQPQVVVVLVPGKAAVRHLIWPAAAPVPAKGQVAGHAARHQGSAGVTQGAGAGGRG